MESSASFFTPFRVVDFKDIGLSRASAEEQAKTLIPAELLGGASPDVLPVVFSIGVVNQFNANGEGVDAETAARIVSTIKNKPLNIEHYKYEIVGHIINASFSYEEPDFHERDMAEFEGETKPFFITCAALIYKNIYTDLAKVVLEASNPESDYYHMFGTSWEVGYNDYSIYVGSNKLTDAVKLDEDEASNYEQYLKTNGGKGTDPNGQLVCRLIEGEVVGLGAAITQNPAADVTGIYTEIFSTNNETLVKLKKIKSSLNMTDKQFEAFCERLTEATSKITKDESQAKDVTTLIRDTLTEHGKEWKSSVEKAEIAETEAKKTRDDLQGKYDGLKTDFDELKSKADAREAAEAFNARMDTIEETFEFDEEKTKLVAQEVKAIGSEQKDFDEYLEKANVLYKENLKTTIASRQEELDKLVDKEIAKRTSNANKDGDGDGNQDGDGDGDGDGELNTSNSDGGVTNNNEGNSDKETLVDRVRKNFGDNVEITN